MLDVLRAVSRVVASLCLMCTTGWAEAPAAISHAASARARELMHQGDDAPGISERQARYDEAEKIAEGVLAEARNDPDANAVLALVDARKVRDANLLHQAFLLPDLRRRLDRALDLAPDDVELLDAKGNLLLRLPAFTGGDPREARSLLARAVALDPQDTTAYLGLSEASPATLRRAVKVHPIAALQTEYSLWSRDPENEILSTCRELGIGFVAYSPLGRGFLAGQIKRFEDLAADDFRRYSPRFQGENFQKNLDLVRRVEQMAKEKGCKPSQLALAWVMAQGEDVVPIPGTKRRKYLEENVAAQAVGLTEKDLRRINEVFPPDSASGARYPEHMLSLLNG